MWRQSVHAPAGERRKMSAGIKKKKPFTPTTTIEKLVYATDLNAATLNPTRGMDNYLLARILALEALAKPVVT